MVRRMAAQMYGDIVGVLVTSKLFRSSETQATCDGCFSRLSICSIISLHSGMSRAVHPQEFSKMDVGHWHIPVWALPFHRLHFMASSLNHWWHVWSDCHLLRQSSRGHGWLLPTVLLSWRLRPCRLHCLHGWWSHPAWQWSPTLTGLWRLSHQCTLWGLVVWCFLDWEAWSLTPFCLLAIFYSAFPSFLVECFIEMLESVWVPFPLFQLAYLQYRVICLTHPRLAPSLSVSLFRLSRFRGVGCGDFR